MLHNVPGTTDRRLDALITLLADNATIVVSGAKIAREIGVSRATVWNWIERLRSLGVKVRGYAGSGYQLQNLPDILAPQMLRRRLQGTAFGKRIHHFFRVESTNSLAMRLGEEGEPHGAVLIAEEQTAGRGRAGRSWHSEKTSGIYVSVLLRPAIPPAEAPVMTLLAGLAVREAVLGQTGVHCDIRWPNDVLVHGRKVCGILTEMHAEPDRVHFVVVGLGMNVNHAQMPAGLETTATSLRMETGRSHARLELLVKLLRQMDGLYDQFLAQGARAIVDRFMEVSSYARGKRVRVSTAGQTYVGTTSGLEPNGLLRVRRDDGVNEVVVCGDVAEAS